MVECFGTMYQGIMRDEIMKNKFVTNKICPTCLTHTVMKKTKRGLVCCECGTLVEEIKKEGV